MGPVHGGGPLSSLQHSVLLNEFNQVNHPFGPSEMTEECLQTNPLGVTSGLDQTVANGIANQACRFMDIKLLHEPRSV